MNMTDPTGKVACAGVCIGIGVGATWAYRAYRAHKLIKTVATATAAAAVASDLMEGSSDTPSPPDGLVGDQGDPRAGQARGKRWNSGVLTPENGGTGDPEADFDGPISEGEGGEYNPDRAPGNRTAPNGATIRPGKKGEGPRIDIPASGDKPPETLHYPPKT